MRQKPEFSVEGDLILDLAEWARHSAETPLEEDSAEVRLIHFLSRAVRIRDLDLECLDQAFHLFQDFLRFLDLDFPVVSECRDSQALDVLDSLAQDFQDPQCHHSQDLDFGLSVDPGLLLCRVDSLGASRTLDPSPARWDLRFPARWVPFPARWVPFPARWDLCRELATLDSALRHSSVTFNEQRTTLSNIIRHLFPEMT